MHMQASCQVWKSLSLGLLQKFWQSRDTQTNSSFISGKRTWIWWPLPWPNIKAWIEDTLKIRRYLHLCCRAMLEERALATTYELWTLYIGDTCIPFYFCNRKIWRVPWPRETSELVFLLFLFHSYNDTIQVSNRNNVIKGGTKLQLWWVLIHLHIELTPRGEPGAQTSSKCTELIFMAIWGISIIHCSFPWFLCLFPSIVFFPVTSASREFSSSSLHLHIFINICILGILTYALCLAE